jgi:hypothetical protein
VRLTMSAVLGKLKYCWIVPVVDKPEVDALGPSTVLVFFGPPP